MLGIFSFAALLPWALARALLHQAHSHPVGKTMFGPGQLALQGFTSLGSLFLLEKPSMVMRAADFAVGLGFLTWMGWILSRHRRQISSAFIAPIILSLVSGVCLYAVLNVVYISGPLAPRYLAYVPLAVIPAFSCWVWQRRSAFTILLVCGLLFASKGWRLALFSRYSTVRQPLSLPADHGIIYPKYFLSARASVPPGYVAITPPAFKWMARWQPGPDQGEQRKVHLRAF